MVRNGKAELTGLRELARRPTRECVFEPQDFRNRDGELVAGCYTVQGVSLVRGHFANGYHGTIQGFGMTDGSVSTYLDVTDGVFTEVEGIDPSGKWTLIECGPGDGRGLDLCRLNLEPGGDRRLARLTHVLDYGGHRVSNPVVSPDGKTIAFQFGRGEDEAGVGMGILVMPTPK